MRNLIAILVLATGCLLGFSATARACELQYAQGALLVVYRSTGQTLGTGYGYVSTINDISPHGCVINVDSVTPGYSMNVTYYGSWPAQGRQSMNFYISDRGYSISGQTESSGSASGTVYHLDTRESEPWSIDLGLTIYP